MAKSSISWRKVLFLAIFEIVLVFFGGLFAALGWGQAVFFFEVAREMAIVGQADKEADLLYLEKAERVAEIFVGLLQTKI